MKPEKFTSAKDNNEYCLNNKDNYKESLSSSLQEILVKFVSVIIEYVRFISEKITMNNEQYYRFIFERGLQSLIHVFSIIIYHTNNLDLTIYHCQKAYYFYIEFIEQIADDNVTFLKLSSKDAVMFVYKRTIFDVNNEVRRKTKDVSNDTSKIYHNLNTCVQFYTKLFNALIYANDFDYKNKEIWMNVQCDNIEQITVYLNKCKLKSLQIECLTSFCDILIDKDLLFAHTCDLIVSFIREISTKKTISLQKNIMKKISDCITSNYIQENGYENLVNYIFSDDPMGSS
jgi:hypothetical protein